MGASWRADPNNLRHPIAAQSNTNARRQTAAPILIRRFARLPSGWLFAMLTDSIRLRQELKLNGALSGLSASRKLRLQQSRLASGTSKGERYER
ncbi:hypothetical protein BJA5080_08172 [Bradyrhizobium diazoefficiens SEMIA 5080]|uniref:Uncharacterized protein n=1 Tax=Bradyrhizobium diazoefficiens SEMIA 5080 TaxID=754504 RepID=A0A837CAP4_9BRAD|nr:hypothetical protein BJA5080_08172 [Bradyrhizobium diazoefficiens SEMIA 5080]